MHTFYLSPEKWRDPYRLEQEEAHHLSRVLRIMPGSRVYLMNGMGRMGIFAVEKCTKKEVLLAPEGIWQEPEPAIRLHLALGWNKSSRRFWLLEKAVELRAWKIIFWSAKNSQGDMDRTRAENWHKRLLAAAKQSRNPWVPELIFIPGGVTELTSYARELPCRIVLWEQERRNNLLDIYLRSKDQERAVVVGPEGGIDPREHQALNAAGFDSATLGPGVLRWETAALSVLCLNMLLAGRA